MGDLIVGEFNIDDFLRLSYSERRRYTARMEWQKFLSESSCDSFSEEDKDLLVRTSVMLDVNRLDDMRDYRTTDQNFSKFFSCAAEKKGTRFNVSSPILQNATSYKAVGSPSVNGSVYRAIDQNGKSYLAVKVDRGVFPVGVHEAYIGRHFLNPLREIVPNFLTTYNAELVNYEEYLRNEKNIEPENLAGTNIRANPRLEIVMEYLTDLVTIKEIMERAPDEEEKRKVAWMMFIQVFSALNCAYDHCGFTHYDLHNENVLFQDLGEDHDIPIYVNRHIYHIKCRYLAKIIDYGMSFAHEGGIPYGFYFADIDFFPPAETHSAIRTQPMLDIYKFVMFTFQNATTSPLRQICRAIFNLVNNDYNTADSRRDLRLADRGRQDYYQPFNGTRIKNYREFWHALAGVGEFNDLIRNADLFPDPIDGVPKTVCTRNCLDIQTFANSVAPPLARRANYWETGVVVSRLPDNQERADFLNHSYDNDPNFLLTFYTDNIIATIEQLETRELELTGAYDRLVRDRYVTDAQILRYLAWLREQKKETLLHVGVYKGFLKIFPAEAQPFERVLILNDVIMGKIQEILEHLKMRTERLRDDVRKLEIKANIVEVEIMEPL